MNSKDYRHFVDEKLDELEQSDEELLKEFEQAQKQSIPDSLLSPPAGEFDRIWKRVEDECEMEQGAKRERKPISCAERLKNMLRRGKDKGFTLVELICVIAILGILVAIAVPSYKGIQDKSARQVAIANARSNYTLGKAQAEMVDSGVMNPSETEDYSYTEDEHGGSATWEGAINGKTYKAVFPGSSGDGEIYE